MRATGRRPDVGAALRIPLRCAVLAACIVVAPTLASSAQAPRTPPLSYTAPRDVNYIVDDGSGDAEDIAMGDLNGDTRRDIAIISSEDGTVSVVLNTGHGFRPSASYAAPDGHVLIADLNGDGSNDLVVSNPGGVGISVLLNRGNGRFLPAVDYSLGHRPGVDELPFALADLNGDGRPDVVAAVEYVKKFFVLLNQGNGTFAPKVAYPAASAPHGIAAGDLNGDGKADVVVPNFLAQSVSVFLNRGDGTFGAGRNFKTSGRPFKVVLADFNGDRKLDVAAGNCCKSTAGVSLLLNRGSGTLATARRYRLDDPFREPVFLKATDLNGDGRPDLVNGQVRLNRGDGRFEPQLCCATGAIGDLNADGKPDQVYPTLDERNGSWNVWVQYADPHVCDVQHERGTTPTVAARTLALSNCRVGRIGYAHSAKVRRGRVLSQKPTGGVWRKGKKVDLVISVGR